MFLDLDHKNPLAEAVVDGDGICITYKELRDFCGEFSRQIGDRALIFILSENVAGSCAGYVAALDGGMVPLMLTASLQADLLQNLIDTYHPSYLWAPRGFGGKEEHVPVFEKWDYQLLSTGHKSPAMAQELALLLPTSGSTGSPKLVRHTLDNVVANARAVAEAFKLGKDSRGMVSLPLNFTQGLNVATSHLYVGGTVLVTRATLTQREFWDFFKEQRAESFTGVPYSYELLDKLRFFKMDLPYLKIINQGGGRMTDELFLKCARYAKESGRQFIATYGSTETTSRMAYLPGEMAESKVGSIGRALPGCEMQLMDDGGNEILTPGVDGEIIFKGPNVTMGYAETAEDLMKGDERQGVYATGDLARFDKDGCFYIVGRKSRFLKLFGYRVSLDSIERHIKTSMGIACACTGSDQCMKVFVEQENKLEEVLQLLTQTTGLHKQAFAVRVIDSIPKNESGKTMYSALNQLS